MRLGFGYWYKFVKFCFFFFFQKAENNKYKKKCQFAKIGSVGPVDQQINLVSS